MSWESWAMLATDVVLLFLWWRERRAKRVVMQAMAELLHRSGQALHRRGVSKQKIMMALLPEPLRKGFQKQLLAKKLGGPSK